MNYVKRSEPVERRAASFENFDPTRLESRDVKSKKSGEVFVIGKPLDYESEHDMFIGMGELSALQKNNPEVAILINKEGKIAQIGEDCILNPKIMLSRINGALECGSKVAA